MPEIASLVPAAARAAMAGGNAVDLDLHGFVGIRLLDARPDDVATVVRQLGPLVVSTLHRDPDITIRFVDRLEPRGRQITVGRGSSLFTAEGMYALRRLNGETAKALIPVQDVGGRCDIVCERAMPAVPMLLAIVNFTALARGILPLHASAFDHKGRGVVVCGWAKGGKTEVLLAFMANGARYIGDEWVYLVPGGGIFGVPEPIRLWSWQLRQLRETWQGIEPRRRAALGLLEVASSAGSRIARSWGSPTLGRVAALLERQQWVQLPPATLFGADAVALRGRLDRLVLTSIHDGSDVTIGAVSGGEVAARMSASLRYERRPFAELYDQFRFAFPSLASQVVETAADIEADLLHGLLPAEAVWLRHPHPVDIASLYQPVLAHLDR